MVGLAASSIVTTDGSFNFRNSLEAFEETFSSRAWELVVVLGVRTHLTDNFMFDVFLGGGYGRATTNHKVNLELFVPYRYLRIEYPSEKNYATFRAEVCPRFSLGDVSLVAGICYRYADIGLVKGPDPPEDFEPPSPYEIYNKEVRFNLSGFTFKGGIAFEF